jgi:hypothetical protein
MGVDVLGVAIRCVFLPEVDKDGGVRGVGGGGEGACDCAFHGAARALMVVFRVRDVGTMPRVRGLLPPAEKTMSSW